MRPIRIKEETFPLVLFSFYLKHRTIGHEIHNIVSMNTFFRPAPEYVWHILNIL